jgi:hypothetical protein
MGTHDMTIFVTGFIVGMVFCFLAIEGRDEHNP